MMTRWFSAAVLAGAVLAMCGWFAWSPFEFSSQEGIANYAKAEDWFRHFPGWWSQSFQGGTSLAPLWGTLLSSLWLWAYVQVLGLAAGIKVSMLACVPLAAGTMFLFTRRLVGRDDTAFCAAVLYALLPSLWMRIFFVEHVVVVCALALLPLVCWSIVGFIREPRALTALVAAVCCSLLALTYVKTALLAAPVLAMFALGLLHRKLQRGGSIIPNSPLRDSLGSLGRSPSINSVGQRPTNDTPQNHKPCKGDIREALISPLQGYADYSSDEGRCPSLKYVALSGLFPFFAFFGVSLFLLGALPNLPALRESRFVAMFEFGPLEGWQHTFCSKSALQLFDRLGGITASCQPDFAASTGLGGQYLGALVLIALAIGLIWQQKIFPTPRLEKIFRAMLALGLFSFWLSFGPYSVLTGTLAAVQTSVGASDVLPALLWLSLLLQGWMVWRIAKGEENARKAPKGRPKVAQGNALGLNRKEIVALKGRLKRLQFLGRPFRAFFLWYSKTQGVALGYFRSPLWGSARPFRAFFVLAIYFLVPGFRILNALPLYRDIRAPFDFYQVAGMVWFCVAAGIVLALVFAKLRAGWRRPALAACALIAGWDFAGYLALPQKTALAAGTFGDFREVAEFLKKAPPPPTLPEPPEPGAVWAFSGRYFYLLLPSLTERPLVQEAFQSYLQQRGYAAMLAVARRSPADFFEFMRIAGVRYIFLDIHGIDKKFADKLRERLPSVFKNEHFEVLEYTETFPRGFVARDTLGMDASTLPNIAVSFEVSGRNFAVVSPRPPDARGDVREGGIFLNKDAPAVGREFVAVPNIERLGHCIFGIGWTFDISHPILPEGRIVFPFAWHPDWVASKAVSSETIAQQIDVVDENVSCAFGGLLSAPSCTSSFRISWPKWYDDAICLSALSWLVAVVALMGYPFFARARRGAQASSL